MKYLYVGLRNTSEAYAITQLSKKYIDDIEFETVIFEKATSVDEIKNNILNTEISNVVIDINVFNDDELNILKSVEGIRQAKNLDVFLVASGYSIESKIIKDFKGLGYSKIITSKDQASIRDDFIENISLKCEYEADKDYIKLKESFNDKLKEDNPTLSKIRQLNETSKTISIGIAGCIRRIGTTTTAVQLAKSLNLDGENNACVIEVNKNSFASNFIKIAEDEAYKIIESDGVRIQNVDIYTNIKKINSIKKEHYNYLIYDYGEIDFEDNSLFEKDIIIFVCGYEPDEMIKSTQITTACVNDYKINSAFYLYNYVSSEQFENILTIQSSYLKKYTFPLGFTPDKFILNYDNADIFSKMLEIAFNENEIKKPGLFKRIFGR